MERAWTIASIVCLLAAAVLLFRSNQEAAFVVAALGAVAWFLSYRVRLRSNAVDAEVTDGESDESEVRVEDEDE